MHRRATSFCWASIWPRGQFRTAGRYLIPILAFAAGVIVAELIKARFRYHPALHWRQITVGAELAILAAVAFLPQRWNVPGQSCRILCVRHAGGELSQDPGQYLCHHHVYRQSAQRNGAVVPLLPQRRAL